MAYYVRMIMTSYGDHYMVIDVESLNKQYKYTFFSFALGLGGRVLN